MLTERMIDLLRQVKQLCEDTLNQHWKEKAAQFGQRLKDNPIFADDELHYSAETLCPCGHGLAYPKECGPGHYWDCSAILKGIADNTVKHTDQLPFTFYKIRGESDSRTTRGVFRPKP